jgi:hypothetical protein
MIWVSLGLGFVLGFCFGAIGLKRYYQARMVRELNLFCVDFVREWREAVAKFEAAEDRAKNANLN